MKLSVIMPVYNREEYVGSALRSLLRQRDAVDLDIIVIDDGSTDGSAEAVRVGDRVRPRASVFSGKPMSGSPGHAMPGLQQLLPQTRLVSFLDSDDISPAGRFKADLACFDDDPGLELTYSRMTLVDGIDDETLEPAADSHSITVRGIHLSAGIFARDLVDRIGGFDEDFKQAEDTDYLLRVFESGPKYIMPDTVALYYRRHPGNMTKEADVSRSRIHARHPQVDEAPQGGSYLATRSTESSISRISRSGVSCNGRLRRRHSGLQRGATIAETLRSVWPRRSSPTPSSSSTTARPTIRLRRSMRRTCRCKLLRQENAGPGSATTRGIAALSTPFVATLDADDLWLPNKIEIQLAHLGQFPQTSGVFTHLRSFRDDRPTRRRPLAVPGWSRTTMMIRREVADTVGPIVDPPGGRGEMIDWIARVREAGFVLAMLDEVLALRRIRPGSLSYGRDAARDRGYLEVARLAMQRRARNKAGTS